MEKKIEILARVGIFGVFLGHGFIAMTSVKWVYLLNYWGFSNEMAMKLLPIIGFADVLIALSILLYPIKAVVAWAAFWAFMTALSRPLAGEPLYEFIERSANFCLPAILFICLQYRERIKSVEAWTDRAETAHG